MPEPPSWSPSTKQVAAWIRARTKIPGGGLAGDFTEQTKVTKADAEGAIEQAVEQVQVGLGAAELCKDNLKSQAGSVASLLAAMIIEQSFYPETTTGESNSFKSLEKLYTGALKRLEGAVEEQCGEGGGGGGGMHPDARGNFPQPTGPGISGPTW